MMHKLLNTDRGFFTFVTCYFVFHVLLRVFTGPALGLDEAEMMLIAQDLKWGYGPQPPLYAWLQYGAFNLLGENILALSLLKNTILCLTYICIYKFIRIGHGAKISGIAALALVLIPQFGWESQRALTHSVLVSFYRL